MDQARRHVAAAGGNGETRPAVALHHDAKTRQQIEGDLDVRLGNQLTHHVDHHRLLARHQRQRQQQGGEELAGDVAAHPDRLVQFQVRRLAVAQPQRRVALLTEAFHWAAQLPQGVDQIADGAFVHARDAAEPERATLFGGEQGQCSRQRAHGGAGIAQKQIGLVGLELPAKALHTQHPVGPLFDGAAQPAQRRQHDAGVVRIQQVGDVGVSDAQGRQQQHTVGNALGAGQTDGAPCAQDRRDVQMGNVVHAGRNRSQLWDLWALMRQRERALLAFSIRASRVSGLLAEIADSRACSAR